MLISCESPLSPSHNELSLDAYEQLKDPALTVHPQALREKIAVNFSGDTELDHFLHHYYTSGKPLVWIGRDGLTSGIGTLLSHIRAVGEIGLDKERFNYSQIVKDLDALKNYGKDSHQSLDELIARVESNLSKTFKQFPITFRSSSNPLAQLTRSFMISLFSSLLSYHCCFSYGTILKYLKYFD